MFHDAAHGRMLYVYTFAGNRREGVKWEEENLDVLPQSKGKRFHSDNEGEGKGMKDKKRKHEQKDTSQVSLLHSTAS